jgi:hypothetical protein
MTNRPLHDGQFGKSFYTMYLLNIFNGLMSWNAD